MGYRSEVAMKIQYASIDDRHKILSRLSEQDRKFVEEEAEIPEDRPIIWFYQDSVKWYTDTTLLGVITGFPEYNALEHLLSESEKANESGEEGEHIQSAGMFLRIGEENDDIDSKFWYALRPNGEIDWDFADPYNFGSIRRYIDFDEKMEQS